MPKDPIAPFVSAVDSGRLSQRLAEKLDEEPFTRFEDWAESLTELANQVGNVIDAIGEWAEAEGREEKAEAKEQALECIELLTTAWQDCPLDLANLSDWVAPE